MTERRFSELSSNESGIVSGYCLKWQNPSFIPSLGRRESFSRGSLKVPPHGVSLTFAHDKKRLLGNTKSNTLKLKEDDVGLWFECKLPESAKDVRELVKRRDVQGSSIEFHCAKDQYEDGTRVVKDALLSGISLVAAPAHEGSLSYREKTIEKPKRKWSKALFTYPEV